jgi:hemerythrin-like domain-containing protein
MRPKKRGALAVQFERRYVLRGTTGLVVAGAGSLATAAVAEGIAQQERQSDQVSPPEDLMREHGVLNRVLLIYEAAIQRIESKQDFDPAIISNAAQIVQQFVEGHHERNEEQQVFPRFRKAGKLVELVDVLYQQHQAGRRLTDNILGFARSASGDNSGQLVGMIRAFIAMYRPHEAREDTVLFPKLRSVVSANEFNAMAEDFEKDERRKFGEDGFESFVEKVAGLEKKLGIYDLAKFTPS